MFRPLLDAQMSFHVAGARDCAPCQKWAKCEDFVAVSKTLAGVEHLKRICKDAFRVGAVQETHESDMLGGPGADFLRPVAFWSIKSWSLLRWFYVTGVQHFVWSGLTFSGAFRQLCTQVSVLKGILQNCFVFDVVNLENWGRLPELLRYWCCQVQNLRKSHRMLRFWCCQVLKKANLAEQFRFQACR